LWECVAGGEVLGLVLRVISLRVWSSMGSEEMLGWQVHTLSGHAGEVYSVAFSRDGTRVVSGSGDMLVRIWDAATGAQVSSFWGVRLVWRGDVGVFCRSFPQVFPWKWSEERVLRQVCTLTGHGLRIPWPD